MMHLFALCLQEALRYFNQTTKQKELMEFAHNYLQTDDEVMCVFYSETLSLSMSDSW